MEHIEDVQIGAVRVKAESPSPIIINPSTDIIDLTLSDDDDLMGNATEQLGQSQVEQQESSRMDIDTNAQFDEQPAQLEFETGEHLSIQADTQEELAADINAPPDLQLEVQDDNAAVEQVTASLDAPSTADNAASSEAGNIVYQGEDIERAELESEATSDEANGSSTASDENDESVTTAALAILRGWDMLSEEQEGRLARALNTNRQTLRDGKYKLLGMSLPLRHHQIAVLSQLIEPGEPERNGFMLADGMGLGKTWSVIAMWCFLRLCTMNNEHWKSHPEMHRRRGDTECRLKNPFSIQCVCQTDSLTAGVVRKITGGPYVVFAPSSVVPNWAAEIGKLVQRTIKVPLPQENGALRKQSLLFLQAANWTNQAFWRMVDMHNGQPSNFSPGRTVASLTIADAVLIKRQQYDSSRCPEPPRALKEFMRYFEQSCPGLENTEDSDSAVRSSSILLFSKEAMLGKCLKETLSSDFSYRYTFGRNQEQQTIKIPLAIVPTQVTFDESHSVKSMLTRTEDLLSSWCKLIIQKSGFATQWCYATATPWLASPMDIESCLQRIYFMDHFRFHTRIGELDRLNTRHTILMRRLRNAQRKGEVADDLWDELGSFGRELAEVVKTYMLARDSQSLVCANPIQVKELSLKLQVGRIGSDNSSEDATEHLGYVRRIFYRAVRHAADGAAQRSDEGLSFQRLYSAPGWTAIFSAAMMPAIVRFYRSDSDTGGSSGATWRGPQKTKEIEREWKRRGGKFFHDNWAEHREEPWATKLTMWLLDLYQNHRTQDGRARHVLVTAQTHMMTSVIVAHLQKHPELQDITNSQRLSATTQSAQKRDQMLRDLATEAENYPNVMYIIVTTPTLISLGINSATFMSAFVQIGEMYNEVQRDQLMGRVLREGQKHKVRALRIETDHEIHKAVRDRNANRQITLYGTTFKA